MWIKNLCLYGFRGLEGCVEFGPRLNIVVGPNCSGKTALIEALAYLLALGYSNLRESHGYLMLLHAARGSFSHSIVSMVRDQGRVIGGVATTSSIYRVYARLGWDDSGSLRSEPNTAESFGLAVDIYVATWFRDQRKAFYCARW